MRAADHRPKPKVHAVGVNIAADLRFEPFEEQVRTLPVGKHMAMPLFAFHPYEFAVGLYPNGAKEECRGWVSIYIMRQDQAEGIVTAECTIEALLPDRNALHRGRVCRSTSKDGYPLELGLGVYDGWKRFAQLEDLRRQGFLLDDALCLRVRLCPTFPGMGQVVLTPQRLAPAEALAKQLGSLLNCPTASDVTFAAGGEEFPVHWSVLICRSPVFRRMLEAGMSEAEKRRVEIPDLDAVTMSRFLRFLYTGSIEGGQELIRSPIGRWHYVDCCYYEIKECNETLVWSETTEAKGRIHGELRQTAPMTWSAKLSNCATITVSLQDGKLLGEYREDASEVVKTEAYNLDAEDQNAPIERNNTDTIPELDHSVLTTSFLQNSGSKNSQCSPHLPSWLDRTPSRTRRSDEGEVFLLIAQKNKANEDVSNWSTGWAKKLLLREVSDLEPLRGKMTSSGARPPFTFSTGAVYIGQWKEHFRHGRGRQCWPDGSTYTGEWLENEASGVGRMMHSSGSVYTGQWIGEFGIARSRPAEMLLMEWALSHIKAFLFTVENGMRMLSMVLE